MDEDGWDRAMAGNRALGPSLVPSHDSILSISTQYYYLSFIGKLLKVLCRLRKSEGRRKHLRSNLWFEKTGLVVLGGWLGEGESRPEWEGIRRCD